MSQGLNRKFDYSDIVARDGNGKRYELVDGELLVIPAPGPIHQRVSRRLQRQLEDYFHERNLGEVFDAPLDVILTFTTSTFGGGKRGTWT
jgi:Uma2 family endonuclease